MNRMRIVLFLPFADPDFSNNPHGLGAIRVREVAAWFGGGTEAAGYPDYDPDRGCVDSESSAALINAYFDIPVDREDLNPPARVNPGEPVVYYWDGIHSVQLENLPPGIRKLYVYGYYTPDDTAVMNAQSSGLQTIELKPGVNHMTVHLNEPLE